MDLQTVWFGLIGVLLIGYAILDGFDLGVGIVHLLHRSGEERRIAINAIGPFWDGNEVWLVAGGGALFAAFPEAYATVFSGFYVPFYLFLAALIFRAASLEFRGQVDSPFWRGLWDFGFSLGSLMAALLLGVALGNIAYGIPLNERHVFVGTFPGLLNPYAVLTGLTTVALFAMQGSLFLAMRTEKPISDRARTWARTAFWNFVLGYVLLSAGSFLYAPPETTAGIRANPLLAIPVLILAAVLVFLSYSLRGSKYGRAFIASSAAIALVLITLGVNLYPNIVPSFPNPANSLTIKNASSSEKTLGIMALVALVGVPIILIYTGWVYWMFRGKVKLDETSY
jgi:cytochrome bd ubiquinol oxidase subunit II